MDKNFQKTFLTEYNRLNKEQLEAVNTIDGPVMVIAGAGTGKTQTITLRIGKILEETQVNPSNILCLTFTDNAALNMRNRLLSIIGPSAYSLKIATFHAFCNSIIQENPQDFLFSTKESRAITDIKKIQIVKELLDKLPPTSPLKSVYSSYFFQNDILRAIQNLKKENISFEKLSKLIELSVDFCKTALSLVDSLNQLRASKKSSDQITGLIKDLISKDIDILYKSQIKLHLDLFDVGEMSLSDLKREVKNFILKTENQIPKQKDLLTLYQGYQQQLKEENLFDFEDMIIWVINQFKKDKNLLANYQEKYQYILVDEFQDTNSSQMEIINLLTEEQESPNIFVVGDDDQSIFRFQGAAVENVFTFYQKYQSTIKTIALKNNYRSHRLILESSESVIKRNQSRITNFISNLDKSLLSTKDKDFDPDPINLFVGRNDIQENYFIAQKVKKLIDSGTEASEIAILFRNNRDIDDLMPFLSHFNIRYLRSDSVNLLENIFIQQLIDLFRYIDDSSDNLLLAKILSFQFLDISSLDLYHLYYFSKKNNLPLLELINNSKQLTELKISSDSQEKLSNFIQQIADLQKEQVNLSLTDFFNKVIRNFKYLEYLLKTQDLNLLNLLNNLYSNLKSTLSLEKINLHQWIQNLDTLVENNLKLNGPPLIDDLHQSVKLMTVHKSKGLEFEHVFLIKVLSGKWDKKSTRNNIRLPLGVLNTEIATTSADQDLEEDRRLFYVALTRAKQQIYISYSQINQSGREQLPSIFVNEIDSKLIEKVKSDNITEADSLKTFFIPQTPKLVSPDLTSYLKNYLSTQYHLSPTHLNSYLKCPLCFFFKNILRIPYPKTRSLSFGTSVHDSLAYLFDSLSKEKVLIPLEKFISRFESKLRQESLSKSDLDHLLKIGRPMLTDYYQHYKDDFNGNCLIEYDFRPYNPRVNDVPLTGKIDKIEILENKKEVNVVDFKTGKPDYKYQALSESGDYFQQLVFYKLLCQQVKDFPYKVKSGTIDFIEKDKKGQYKKKNFNITDDHVEKLTQLITETFKKITNLDFTPSDQCKDPDHLHYLFDKYFKK